MPAKKTTKAETVSVPAVASPHGAWITERIFWCLECEAAYTSTKDTLTCPNGHDMTHAGWFESRKTQHGTIQQAGTQPSIST